MCAEFAQGVLHRLLQGAFVAGDDEDIGKAAAGVAINGEFVARIARA